MLHVYGLLQVQLDDDKQFAFQKRGNIYKKKSFYLLEVRSNRF